MEYQFAFACIWAFGGALSADKVADHRAGFSKWWVTEWKNVSFPDQVRAVETSCWLLKSSHAKKL